MRTLLAALLLTSVAAPALAAEPTDNDQRSSVFERLREARQERAERQEQQREQVRERVREVRSEQAGDNGILRAERAQRAQRVARPDRPVITQSDEFVRSRDVVRQQRLERRADRNQAVEQPGSATPDSVATWRSRERQRDGRPVLTQNGQLVRSPVVTTTQVPVRRDGIQGQVAERLRQSGVVNTLADPAFQKKWREDWRRDQRHDWRRYRDRHRSLFRFGYYYDPFGFGYHRFGLGWQIWPAYYSSHYWLNDPWQYRLPYVGYPYRWVRYWDDAVLVDVRTGRVVDVIYDFFW